MASTKKRKRVKSQLDGKREDADAVKGTTADSRPLTKKSRNWHPAQTQLPVLRHQSLPIHHPVLSLYFPTLLLLRKFLELTLSFSPKLGSLKKLEKVDKETDTELAFLLDTTVVGLKETRTQGEPDIQDATQSSGGFRPDTSLQSEV